MEGKYEYECVVTITPLSLMEEDIDHISSKQLGKIKLLIQRKIGHSKGVILYGLLISWITNVALQVCHAPFQRFAITLGVLELERHRTMLQHDSAQVVLHRH